MLTTILLALLPAVTHSAEITAPPAERKFPPFYKKCVSVGGIPVVSSEKVSDYALKEATYLIEQTLVNRPDIIKAIADSTTRFSIMAATEFTTDIPEHSDLKPREYWDRRARGLGATAKRPSVSCGEENLLDYPGDPYATENILIHEFGHVVHEIGLAKVDPTFDRRLKETYDHAIKAGLFKGKYAAVNRNEYWAEGVQDWFDCNRENDSEHNHVNTRAELIEYDPSLAKLLAEVFGDGPWRYAKPRNRKPASPHLAGFDRAQAPRFKWPERLLAWQRQMRNGDAKADTGQTITLGPLAPDTRSDWRSPKGGPSTELLVFNMSDQTVRLEWIDFDGEPTQYYDVRPGTRHEQHTYAGHVWRVVTEQGKPIAYYIAEAKPCTIILKAKSTAPAVK